MLNGIHLVDYGNHRDTRLTFGRMTALVGQNGAGKTNILRAIMEVSSRFNGAGKDETGTDSEKERRGTFGWWISAGWPGALNLGFQAEQEGSWAVQIKPQQTAVWYWRADAEAKGVWIPRPGETFDKVPLYNMNSFWDEPAVTIAPAGMVRLGKEQLQETLSWKAQYFKTAGSYLQAPSYSDQFPPGLSEDCRDLAWMIAYLKGARDEVFAGITAALQKVVPSFQRVRHQPVPIIRLEKREVVINKQPRLYDEEQKVMGQELRFDMASGSDLPASSISEGTLITLAILTAIMHDDCSSGDTAGIKTILLDDIESGLHPSAQRDLIRQLQRLQETRSDLQIVFSSHSPYIIDEMQPEDVWLLAPDTESIAHSARLSEHPDAKRALEVLTTGEFWSAEGEEWVLDRVKDGNLEPITAR